MSVVAIYFNHHIRSCGLPAFHWSCLAQPHDSIRTFDIQSEFSSLRLITEYLQLGLDLILLHHDVCYNTTLDLSSGSLGHVVCEVHLQSKSAADMT